MQTAPFVSQTDIKFTEASKPILEKETDVKAVATNPVDGKLASFLRNFSSPSLSFSVLAEEGGSVLTGFDCAGIIEAVGSGVKNFKVGDEVYYSGNLERPGCFAEYHLVDENIIALKPSKLSFEDAAAIPLTYLTAWEPFMERNIFTLPSSENPEPNKDKSILIIGGAGGVGCIAIQLAKKVFKVGTVIATASRDETVEYCKKMGADKVINHRNKLSEELGGSNIVDVVFCTADLFHHAEECVKVVKPLGNLITITGYATVTFGWDFAYKRISVHFEYMSARPTHGVHPEMQAKALSQAAGWFDDGTLVTTAHTRFDSMKHLPQALKLQSSGKAIGKIVLTANF